MSSKTESKVQQLGILCRFIDYGEEGRSLLSIIPLFRIGFWVFTLSQSGVLPGLHKKELSQNPNAKFQRGRSMDDLKCGMGAAEMILSLNVDKSELDQKEERTSRVAASLVDLDIMKQSLSRTLSPSGNDT